VILVEGLFDYAALWQAGFHHVTCGLGTQLNAHQFRQFLPEGHDPNSFFTAGGDAGQFQALLEAAQ
jgi:DNA primase